MKESEPSTENEQQKLSECPQVKATILATSSVVSSKISKHYVGGIVHNIHGNHKKAAC